MEGLQQMVHLQVLSNTSLTVVRIRIAEYETTLEIDKVKTSRIQYIGCKKGLKAKRFFAIQIIRDIPGVRHGVTQDLIYISKHFAFGSEKLCVTAS